METTIVEDGQETKVWTSDLYSKDQEANLMHCLKEFCLAQQEAWAQDDPREVESVRKILCKLFVGDTAIFSAKGANFGVTGFDQRVEDRKNPNLSSVKRILAKKGKEATKKDAIDFFTVTD